jgi:hypothetical protein
MWVKSFLLQLNLFCYGGDSMEAKVGFWVEIILLQTNRFLPF